MSAKLKAASAGGIDREKVVETLKKDIAAFVPEADLASKREMIGKYIKE